MNKMLIVYRNDGTIISKFKEPYKKPIGLSYLEVEVPKGKMVVGVNVTTKEAIFEDAPKTKEDVLNETISVLTSRIANAEYLLLMGGLN